MSLKKVIITGGCGDIGFATGKFFKSKGFEVVLTGINEEEINSRTKIENVSYEILDVTSDESAQELISKHNCDILTNIKDDVYHVDREKWWEDPKTQKLFVEEKYKHIEDEKIRESITEVGYSENALFTTKKFTTYEELATALINQWENSYYHKCLQRRNMFCTYLYRSHNIIVKDLFACSVTYNPSTKCVHSVINFI